MSGIYLDNASTTFPKPPCVGEAVLRYMTESGSNVGRGGYRSAYDTAELVFETRERRDFHEECDRKSHRTAQGLFASG